MFGKLSKEAAEKAGFDSDLYREWSGVKLQEGRELNEQEWQVLVKHKTARDSARKEREREQVELEFKEKAKTFADRTDKLTPKAIAGLQSAKLGRTAALNEKTASVVVKLADDPVHDRSCCRRPKTEPLIEVVPIQN